MSIFSYKAENEDGRIVEGMVDAVSAETVANLLSEKGLAVISIIEKDTGKLSDTINSIISRVKVRDLVIFFRQLSVMIKANLPIVRALNILVKQTRNQYFKVVIAGIADEVDGGAKLSDSMSSFPAVFGNFYINVIRSGETSGRLSEVIDYLADQQEKDYDLQSRIKGAMIYPAFIVVGLLGVGFILMTFVVPQMTGMLLEAGVDLPLATRILIGLSSFLRGFWWLIAIVIVFGGGGLFYFVRQTESGIRMLDSLKLKSPIFGKIFQKIYIVRISRSLSTLIRGGVPIARALEVVREIVGNRIYRDILDSAIEGVDEGNSLSESLAPHKEMPIMVSQMMSVGEETGRIDEVLEKMTDFYSREIDASVTNLSTLIEPFIMVILGVGIGVFVAAIIMPMWQLSAAF